MDVVFDVFRVDIFHGEKNDLIHILEKKSSFVDRIREEIGEDSPRIFALNLIISGDPFISIVTYYARQPNTGKHTSFEHLWDKFENGTDEFRNSRLKLIPCIEKGPWIVRRSVGKRPLIVANALRVQYFKGRSYLEAVVDTSSDAVANKVTSLCRLHVRAVEIDIGIVLEGQNENELPEALLGCTRYSHLDLTNSIKATSS